MIDLRPDHLEIIKRILAERVPDYEVRAFGSRAAWTGKEYSDLDLAVVGKRKLPFKTLAALRTAFEESDLPFRVDVIDWHAVNKEFRRRIEKQCVVIREPDAPPLAAGGSPLRWSSAMAGSTLSQYADIVMGQSPPGNTCNNSGDGLPLLNGPTEYGAHHPTPVQFTTDARKRAKPGDILFCVRGSTTGRMNWADREYAIGRGVAAVRHKRMPGLQPFVRAVIEYSLPNLLLQATGSTFPNVSADQLASIWWPSLDVKEQQAIASILGSLDDKIENNRRMNETLEAMARAVFKSWFTDFDPVHARAAGRKPTGMTAATAKLFPDSFVDSPVGKIPKGWKSIQFSDAMEVNPNRILHKGVVAPYLDMQNMPTSGHRPISWVDRPYGSGMRFINGDTLVARITPCLENGKTAFVDFLPEEQVGWGSTEYIVIRPRSPLPVEYGYFLARSEEFRIYVISNMTGTSGRQRAPANCLDHYDIVVPTEKVVAKFGEFVHPLMSKITTNDDQSRTLAVLRDALLAKLLTGELPIPDAERIVGRRG